MFLNGKPLAVLAGVSKEEGVDMVMVFEDSVNKEKFKMYIDALRLKYPADDICFFIDNLSVHRSYEVRRHLEINNIPYIFCPAYSPDFNGIESVFSIYKNILKR